MEEKLPCAFGSSSFLGPLSSHSSKGTVPLWGLPVCHSLKTLPALGYMQHEPLIPARGSSSRGDAVPEASSLLLTFYLIAALSVSV